jgi:hypothetical protein
LNGQTHSLVFEFKPSFELSAELEMGDLVKRLSFSLDKVNKDAYLGLMEDYKEYKNQKIKTSALMDSL